jgi:hypothetical protein
MNDRSTSRRAVPHLENSASLPNVTKIIFVRMLSCSMQLMRTAWTWERIRGDLALFLGQHRSRTQNLVHIHMIMSLTYKFPRSCRQAISPKTNKRG